MYLAVFYFCTDYVYNVQFTLFHLSVKYIDLPLNERRVRAKCPHL